MFLSINNPSSLPVVKNTQKQDQFPLSDCIIEALKLCLESNNFIFNNKHYFLQTDGTDQGYYMSSYIVTFSLKVLIKMPKVSSLS